MQRRQFLTLVSGAALLLPHFHVAHARPKRPATQAQPAKVVVTKGVIYTVSPAILRCDIYRPTNGGPSPVVFLVYDGYWQQNGGVGAADDAQRLADAGFASIFMQLRTAPTYHAPAPMEDLAHLLDFVVTNAALYNLDPNQLAAMGGSGGGHVASFLSLGDELRPDQFARVRCTIPASAPTALREMDADGAAGDFTRAINEFLGVTEAESPQTWELFSPARRVTTATKPMFLPYSQGDPVPSAQGQRLANALTTAGVEHQFKVYAGSLHGWALIRATGPWADIVAYLRGHLG